MVNENSLTLEQIEVSEINEKKKKKNKTNPVWKPIN